MRNSTIPFTKRDVLIYLDHDIIYWREQRNSGVDYAKYYVDAFQSVRTSLFGETFPLPDMKEPGA